MQLMAGIGGYLLDSGGEASLRSTINAQIETSHWRLRSGWLLQSLTTRRGGMQPAFWEFDADMIFKVARACGTPDGHLPKGFLCPVVACRRSLPAPVWILGLT